MKLRKLVCVLCSFLSVCCFSVHVLAEQSEYRENDCKILLEKAESIPDDSIYDQCGFDNESVAWNTWAPYASAKGMKRALFELCKRYPQHEYGPLYCQKAIDLNYGPALARQGFLYLEAQKFDEAIALFERALKTDELSLVDKTKIKESLGVMYIKEESPVYNPAVGTALLSQASGERSAMANNILGYLYFSGKAGLKQNMKEAFTCFWRAILLGCPAAEENLGYFHLARQKKITISDALSYMERNAFSCESGVRDSVQSVKTKRRICPCNAILEREALFQSQPYLYVGSDENNLDEILQEYDEDEKSLNKEKNDQETEKHSQALKTYVKQAVLRDKSGKEFHVKRGDNLPDGTYVSELRPRAVVLLKNLKRIVINRYHEGECVVQCLSEFKNPVKVKVAVKPYRLSFTQNECADLMYYAHYLVDDRLPFVGKEECKRYQNNGIEMDEASRLLLGLDENPEPL